MRWRRDCCYCLRASCVDVCQRSVRRKEERRRRRRRGERDRERVLWVRARRNAAEDGEEVMYYEADFAFSEVEAAGERRVAEQAEELRLLKLERAGGEAALANEEENVEKKNQVNKDEKETDEKLGFHWDQFHSNHMTGTFFKERRYITKAFPELLNRDQVRNVLEVGVGSGSSAVALLRARIGARAPKEDVEEATKAIEAGLTNEEVNLHVTGIDVSSVAVSLAEKNVMIAGGDSFRDAFRARCCDICVEIPPSPIQWQNRMRKHNATDDGGTHEDNCSATSNCDQSRESKGYDAALMVFTLSAIPLDSAVNALRNVASSLRCGGLLLIRDYGVYDMAMLRFGGADTIVPGQLYRRRDGTLARFMTLETLQHIVEAAGLQWIDGKYCTIRLENRKTKQEMNRIFVQGKAVYKSLES